MTSTTSTTRLTSDQRSSFLAAWLGWTMDAFDYFIVVLVYADIGEDFGVSLPTMAFLTTVTLVCGIPWLALFLLLQLLMMTLGEKSWRTK